MKSIASPGDALIDKLDRAVRCSFYALIFFLPISIALVESFSAAVIFFYAVKKVVLGRRGAALAPAGGISKIRAFWFGFKPQGSILAGIMAVNILVVFVSVFFSQYLSVSAFAFVAKFLEGCFLFYAFVECFQDRVQVRIFLGVWAASASVICLSGLSQYFFYHDFVRGTPLVDGRMASTFRHANDFGAYLIVVLIMAMAFIFIYLAGSAHKTGKKVLFGLGMLLTMVCLGLTYSRSAWMGFFAGTICLGVVSRRFFSGAILITAFIFFFLPLMVSLRHVSLVSDDLPVDRQTVDTIMSERVQTASPLAQFDRLVVLYKTRAEVVLQQFGGMGRLNFWKEAAQVIQTSPWFGAGLNTYSRVAPKFRISWGGYAHNCYLQMAAEIGLLGLGSFLLVLGTLWWRSFWAIRRMKDDFSKAAAFGVGAGLIGFCFQSAFDTTLYSVQLANLMWILIGLLVAIVAIERKNNSGQARSFNSEML